MLRSCNSGTFVLVATLMIRILNAAAQEPRAGCSLNLSLNSPQYPPHLIDANNRVILPVIESGSRIINLAEGQPVTVACLGYSTNNLLATGLQTNPATCTAANSLLVNGQTLTYDKLGCVRANRDALVETGVCANGPGTTITSGWQAGSTFIPLYDMCHDKALALNYFSTHYIAGNSADADDKGNSPPSFSQATYYPGINVNTAYTQAQQTITIANIVGSESLAAYYVNISKSFYLARGHMAPDGDFIDGSSQDASYYFMNAAPQWQSFNNGNWVALESRVRALAITRRVDFTVYTGTFGVCTLADVNGAQQPIYLAVDANNNGLIPAPKYFWKVIHHLPSNTATAVVGINNPHLSEVLPTDIICPDVCSQVPWIDFDVANIPKGYTFCCTTAELKKAIDFAPDLDVPLFV